MSEADLEKLKYLATPEPDAGAKEQALAAALASFNEADATPADGAMTPQENTTTVRLTHIDPITDRRSIMRLIRSRPAYAVAASIGVLAICVPLALQVRGIGPFSPPQDAQSRLQREPKIIKAPTGLAKTDLLTKRRADSKPRSETSTPAQLHEAKAKPSTSGPPPAASHVADGRKLARLGRSKEVQRVANKLKRQYRTAAVTREWPNCWGR